MSSYSGNFDLATTSTPPVWFGRVVSKESWTGNIASSKFDKSSKPKGWGYRYRVRIFHWNTGDKNALPDDQCIMANVILPVTAGSGLGGSATTPSIEPGTMVTGFFLDGMGAQEAYITGILINSNNNVPKKQGNGLTSGFDIFNDTYKDGTNPSKVPHDRIVKK